MFALFSEHKGDYLKDRLELAFLLCMFTVVTVIIARLAALAVNLGYVVAGAASAMPTVGTMAMLLGSVVYVVNGLVYAHKAEDRDGRALDEVLIGTVWPVVYIIGLAYAIGAALWWVAQGVWNLVGRLTGEMG